MGLSPTVFGDPSMPFQIFNGSLVTADQFVPGTGATRTFVDVIEHNAYCKMGEVGKGRSGQSCSETATNLIVSIAGHEWGRIKCTRILYIIIDHVQSW